MTCRDVPLRTAAWHLQRHLDYFGDPVLVHVAHGEAVDVGGPKHPTLLRVDVAQPDVRQPVLIEATRSREPVEALRKGSGSGGGGAREKGAGRVA